MTTPQTFALLAELAANNNKAWFDAHRNDFEEAVVRPVISVLEDASIALAATDMPLIGGVKTMFRLNRDLRFSTDKSPYKNQVSGLLTPDGEKSPDEGVAYLQFDENGGHMSAGYYNLKPEVLTRIRNKIVDQPTEFRKVLDRLGANNLDLTREMSLIGTPRDYARHKAEWFAEYLKFRVFLVRTKLPTSVWTDGTLVKRFVDHTLACSTLIRFGQS
jgi:uncharacterized protein (TIGR02453 family)